MTVISDLYVFDISNVVGRDTHEYLSVSIQCIPRCATALLPSKLGLYDPSQTIIRFLLLVSTTIHALSNSPYVFSLHTCFSPIFPYIFYALWGSVIWRNHHFYPLVYHMLPSCLFNLYYMIGYIRV